MERLLKLIDSKYPPQYIPIVLEEYSDFEGCFYNVQEKIKKSKGEIIYGWKLHGTPILIKAERHSIWKSPSGELIDLTPDKINSQKTLFVQDDKGWIFNGQFEDNIRVNITNNPLVDDYILLNEAITKLFQTGRRKSKTEIYLLEPINKVITLFTQDKVLREKFIYSNKTLDSNCYCGSHLTYRNCHGNNLKEVYSETINKAYKLVKNSN